MTPQAALIELLARVGVGDGAAVLVDEEELSQWPTAALAAMKSQRLITKARPTASAVCPGCERECVMPVHSPPIEKSSPVSFIVCDKRSDINRVAVPITNLNQWQCSTDAVCGFVAACLELHRPYKRNPTDFLEIGITTGGKRSQMLCLQTNGELILIAGGNKVPLADIITFGEDAYSVDRARVRMLVDDATTVESRYIPSTTKRELSKLATQAMYKDWQKAYRELKRKHTHKSDVWYAQKIAKTKTINPKGRDADTIRKHMKK
jgi:hypothetical protein